MNNILLIGSTGFTGSYILNQLLKKNDSIYLYVRSINKAKSLKYNDLPVNIIKGDLANESELIFALKNIDIVIYVASLGLGHVKKIISVLEKSNVKKIVFTSTTGIFTRLNPDSKQIRLDAENDIRNSNLNYTIIRPTMIYGSKEDRNMSRLITFIRKMPVIPVFGSGKFLQQPIHVEDLAKVIIQAAYSKKSTRKSYNVSGASPITYNDIIKTVTSSLNTYCKIIHIPLNISILLANFFERLLARPIIKVEQIKRLNEHKAFTHDDAKKDLNFKPREFSEGILNEIKSMKLL